MTSQRPLDEKTLALAGSLLTLKRSQAQELIEVATLDQAVFLAFLS